MYIQIRHSTRDHSAQAISDLSPGCLIVFDRATGVRRALISPLPQRFSYIYHHPPAFVSFPFPSSSYLHKRSRRPPSRRPCLTDTFPVRSLTGTSACTSPPTLTPTPSSPTLPIPRQSTPHISTGAPPPSLQLPPPSRTAPTTPTHPPIRSFPPLSCPTRRPQMA